MGTQRTQCGFPGAEVVRVGVVQVGNETCGPCGKSSRGRWSMVSLGCSSLSAGSVGLSSWEGPVSSRSEKAGVGATSVTSCWLAVILGCGCQVLWLYTYGQEGRGVAMPSQGKPAPHCWSQPLWLLRVPKHLLWSFRNPLHLPLLPSSPLLFLAFCPPVGRVLLSPILQTEVSQVLSAGNQAELQDNLLPSSILEAVRVSKLWFSSACSVFSCGPGALEESRTEIHVADTA